MTSADLPRELLSDRIHEIIRSEILDGTRPPGSRVVESEIARGLDVSQAPVREAVKRLVHAGLVTSEPRRGSYVTEISQGEFAIARELRAALESIAARAAVENLTPVDIADLRDIVRQMKAALAESDSARFRSLDMQFHARALMIGNHAVLSRVWDAVEPVLVSQRAIGDPAYTGNKDVIVEWHEHLIATLESGEPEAAAQAFFDHASGALNQEVE